MTSEIPSDHYLALRLDQRSGETLFWQGLPVYYFFIKSIGCFNGWKVRKISSPLKLRAIRYASIIARGNRTNNITN
jgi:hypothetical protein